ncbi:MAG: hypothetical protein IKL97_04160, partial [Eggerthellaceae bacterium]|nr:hypothetical protein [Eggerthellaceae bacterium]
VLSMALAIYDLVGKYIAASIAPFVISTIQTATGTWVYCSIPIAICAIFASISVWVLGLRMDKETKRELDSSE